MGKIADIIIERGKKFYGISLGTSLQDGHTFTDLVEKEIIELIKKEVIPIDNPPLCNEAVIDKCLINLEKLKGE